MEKVENPNFKEILKFKCMQLEYLRKKVRGLAREMYDLEDEIQELNRRSKEMEG